MTIRGKLLFLTVVFLSFLGLGGLVGFLHLHRIENKVRHVIEIQEPASRAVCEMALRIAGIGMGTLKYLDTGDKFYQDRVTGDAARFARSWNRYMELVHHSKARRLGAYFYKMYEAFLDLGRVMMSKKDRKDWIFSRLTVQFETMERDLDGPFRKAFLIPPSDRGRPGLILEKLKAHAARIGQGLGVYLLSGDLRWQGRIFGAANGFYRTLNRLKEEELSNEQKNLVERLEHHFDEIMDRVREIQSLDDELKADIYWYLNMMEQIDELLNGEIRSIQFQMFQDAKMEARRILGNAVKIQLVLFTVFLAVGIVLSYRLVLGITGPLSQLVSISEAIGKGDFSKRVVVDSRDEIGQLGEAFNTMAESLERIDRERNRIIEALRISEESLKEARQDLEQRVRERTAELEKANRELLQEKEEREKAQAQLLHAQKMEAIGTLAGGIAHDFNNLLTIILGNVDVALMDVSEDSPLYPRLQAIRQAGTSAAALTSQLLAFSRRQMVQPQKLNLNDLLTSRGKMMRRLLREDIELEIHCAENLKAIRIDPVQMEQVLLNLASNAMDAMPDGGTFTLETANVVLDETYFRERGVEGQEGWYVLLAATDTGIGMDEETRSRIFEPFFTTKEKGRGTGMGLATVYGIVKQNDGFIWVYSEPGKGTTFKIYFPALPGDEDVQPKVPSMEDLPRGSETVLVVEDDQDLRNIAQWALERTGYKVFVAENGVEALEIFESHGESIQLVLADMVMPQMSGLELAEKIRSLKPDVAVIFMSGYPDRSASDRWPLDEPATFISKPFTVVGLLRTVRRVLNERKKSSEPG